MDEAYLGTQLDYSAHHFVSFILFFSNAAGLSLQIVWGWRSSSNEKASRHYVQRGGTVVGAKQF